MQWTSKETAPHLSHVLGEVEGGVGGGGPEGGAGRDGVGLRGGQTVRGSELQRGSVVWHLSAVDTHQIRYGNTFAPLSLFSGEIPP